MNTAGFLQERWNRQYVKLLLFLGAVLIGLSMFFGYLELVHLKKMLLFSEGTTASYLLAEGVPADLLARASTQTEITEQGAAFLAQIGHHQNTSFWLFPKVWPFVFGAFVPKLSCILIFCLFLLLATVYQMRRREALYQQAAELVERFTEKSEAKRS